MKKILLLAVSSLAACSSTVTSITATANEKRVDIHFSSRKPIQDMNQGTEENPILTGFFFRSFNSQGKKIGDDVFLGFNSSDYIKDIKKSSNGRVSIEYNEIYSTLQEWHHENPKTMDEISRIEIFWKPFFTTSYKIPVECLKNEKQVISCKTVGG